MKKLLLPLLLACSIVAVSCQKEQIAIKSDVTSVPVAGGTVKIDVTSNTTWNVYASQTGVTFDKTCGTGDATIVATIPENPGTSARSIDITVKGSAIEMKVQVNQDANVRPSIECKDISGGVDFEGGKVEMNIVSTVAWKGSILSSDEKYVPVLDKTSGTAGTTKIAITFPENLTGNDVLVEIRFTSSNAVASVTQKFTVNIDAPGIEYGGVTYKIAKMADGRWWMAENLRYVPDGCTPCSDLKNVTAGVYCPIQLNSGHTAVEFTNDEAVIKANGYLYQSEVALGLNVGDLKSEADAKSLEGRRGICPEGWHIPTATEIINLVGKAVAPYETKKDAPYYDADKDAATIEKLNADGFNAGAWGAVTIQDNTKTSATLMGYLKKTPDIISSGYICGSTYTGKTEKEGKITNYQFLGFMPMANNGTFNGAKLSYRIGASVRCIKNAKK